LSAQAGPNPWSPTFGAGFRPNDYAKFIISVMNNERVAPEIATQRLTIHRNQMTPDKQTELCQQAPDPVHCNIEIGFGLSYKINDDIYLRHTGSDRDIKTLASA
jgi:hypothetical protein